MTVINVYTCDKRFVGSFANTKAMITYLIDREYIRKNFEIPYGSNWLTLEEAFGEEWVDKIVEWDIENFAASVMPYLIIQEVEVID